jgi:hypothetical protein
VPSIRIEAVPVQQFFLGLFSFDHLHLVYADDATGPFAQDRWFVIEGLQDGSIFGGTLSVIGVDGTLPLSAVNGAIGQALVDAIGTPEDRGSRAIVDGPNAFAVWSAIAGYADDIDSQQFPYVAAAWPFSVTPTVNSTSVIASLLWWAGYEISSVFGIA